MANQDDNNNQEIEKVEDVEVETTKNTSDTDNKKQPKIIAQRIPRTCCNDPPTTIHVAYIIKQ